MRASADDADVVLAAIEGLSDDELNDCAIEGGIRQTEAMPPSKLTTTTSSSASSWRAARTKLVPPTSTSSEMAVGSSGTVTTTNLTSTAGGGRRPSPEPFDHDNDNFVLPKYFRDGSGSSIKT